MQHLANIANVTLQLRHTKMPRTNKCKSTEYTNKTVTRAGELTKFTTHEMNQSQAILTQPIR
jgi:hypothetical protein